VQYSQSKIIKKFKEEAVRIIRNNIFGVFAKYFEICQLITRLNSLAVGINVFRCFIYLSVGRICL
jgi:hypothetical protein